MTNNPYIPYNKASFGEINYPFEMTGNQQHHILSINWNVNHDKVSSHVIPQRCRCFFDFYVVFGWVLWCDI